MHSNLMSCKKFKKQCLCHYLQNTNDPWFLRLPVCLDINFLSICKNLHLASQWPHCEALLPGPNSLTLWYSFSRHPAKHSARTEVRIFRYRISQHTPPRSHSPQTERFHLKGLFHYPSAVNRCYFGCTVISKG